MLEPRRQKITNITYYLYLPCSLHPRTLFRTQCDPGKWPRALVITRRKVESRGSATSESEVSEVLSNMFLSRSDEIYLLSERDLGDSAFPSNQVASYLTWLLAICCLGMRFKANANARSGWLRRCTNILENRAYTRIARCMFSRR